MSLLPSHETFDDALAYVLHSPFTVVTPVVSTSLSRVRTSKFRGIFDRSEFFATSAITSSAKVPGYGAFSFTLHDIDGIPGNEMKFQLDGLVNFLPLI